jgi:hypothetical protein
MIIFYDKETLVSLANAIFSYSFKDDFKVSSLQEKMIMLPLLIILISIATTSLLVMEYYLWYNNFQLIQSIKHIILMGEFFNSDIFQTFIHLLMLTSSLVVTYVHLCVMMLISNKLLNKWNKGIKYLIQSICILLFTWLLYNIYAIPLIDKNEFIHDTINDKIVHDMIMKIAYDGRYKACFNYALIDSSECNVLQNRINYLWKNKQGGFFTYEHDFNDINANDYIVKSYSLNFKKEQK